MAENRFSKYVQSPPSPAGSFVAGDAPEAPAPAPAGYVAGNIPATENRFAKYAQPDPYTVEPTFVGNGRLPVDPSTLSGTRLRKYRRDNSVEQTDGPSYGGNLARAAGERAMNVAGGMTRFVGQTADDLADWLEERVPLGQIVIDETGIGWRPSTQEDIDRESPLLSVARDLEGADLGVNEDRLTTWEQVKSAPLSSVLPFALEQGLISIPDMAAVIANLPAYVAARTGEIGQARAENDKRSDATLEDFLAAAPASIGSAFLERLGAKGIIGLDEVAVQSARQIPQEAGKAGLKEAGTEAAQEGLESTAETLGTERGFDAGEIGERMLSGAVAGGPFGAGVRAVTGAAQAAQANEAPSAGQVEPGPSAEAPSAAQESAPVAPPTPGSAPQTYAVGDTIQVNDPGGPLHGAVGTVINPGTPDSPGVEIETNGQRMLFGKALLRPTEPVETPESTIEQSAPVEQQSPPPAPEETSTAGEPTSSADPGEGWRPLFSDASRKEQIGWVNPATGEERVFEAGTAEPEITPSPLLDSVDEMRRAPDAAERLSAAEAQIDSQTRLAMEEEGTYVGFDDRASDQSGFEYSAESGGTGDALAATPSTTQEPDGVRQEPASEGAVPEGVRGAGQGGAVPPGPAGNAEVAADAAAQTIDRQAEIAGRFEAMAKGAQDLGIINEADVQADRPVLRRGQRVNAGPFTREVAPLDASPVLFHETSAEGLRSIVETTLTNNADGGPSRIYVTDDQDLAIGQGANRGGVRVRFRGDALSGQENVKPATGVVGGREYLTDFMAPDAIDEVFVPDGVRLDRFTDQLLRGRGRFDVVPGDVGTRYVRKNPDGSFKTSDRPTGVATRTVVIDKAGGSKLQAVSRFRTTPRFREVMGMDAATIEADFDQLQARHPEYYDTAAEVRRDVEFVFQDPDDWFPWRGTQKVVLFRQRESDLPSVRVELTRDGDRIRVDSVYVMHRRQIARNMKRKNAEIEALLPGRNEPDQLTAADYLAAVGSRSRLPSSSSEEPQQGNQNIGSSRRNRKDRAARGEATRPLTADGERAVKAALDALKRIAPNAQVRLQEEIIGADGTPAGFGSYAEGIITLALNSPDLAGTARHEAIHFLREVGAIKPQQWRALKAAAEREGWIEKHGINERPAYADLSYEAKIEEAIAEEYASRQPVTGKSQVDRVFANLRELFDRIRAAMRRALGREPTAADIFADIESGRTGRQERAGSIPGMKQWPRGARPISMEVAENKIADAIRERVRDSSDVTQDRPLPRLTDPESQRISPREEETVSDDLGAADTNIGNDDDSAKLQAPLKPKSAAGSKALTPAERTAVDQHLAPREAGIIARIYRAIQSSDMARDGVGDTLVTQIVNALNPIFAYEKRASDGKIGDASVSAAKMAEFTMNDSGRTWAMFHAGPLKFNAEEGVVEADESAPGLYDIFKYLSDPDTYDRFRLYAAARRGKRLMAEGREHNLTQEAIDQGMALENEVGTYKGETRSFRSVFDDYQAFNKALLEGMGRDTGLLSQEDIDTFTQHMDYVPFYRVLDETGDVPSVGWLKKHINKPDAGIRRLEGGESRIGDLMENISHNAMAITRAGMRNVTMRRIFDLAEILGEGQIVREGGADDGVLTYKVNGREVKFTVEDPALVAAVAAMRPEQYSGIHRLAVAMTSFFRNSIVAAPAFMLRNLIRGSTAAFIQTGKNVSLTNNTITGLRRSLTNAKSVRELKTISGTGAYTFGGPAGEVGARIRCKIGAERELMPVAAVRGIWSALEHIGEATELADRDAIYMNLLKQGASKAEAAYQAMNLINYSRKGASRSLRIFLPMIPFLNARIQGLYRMAETQTTGRDKAQILAGVAVRGLMLTAISVALREAMKEDARYDDEPMHRKLNYYIVYNGHTRLLIPKAFEFGAIFSTIPELVLDAIEMEEGERLAEGLAQTLLVTFAFNPIPQPALPILENLANYNSFMDREIENVRLENLPAGQRYNAGTPHVIRAVGDATDTSPVMIENLVRGYTGTMGMSLLAGLDTIGRAAGAFPSEPEGAFGSLPVFSEVMKDQLGSMYKKGPDPANRWIGDLYEMSRQVNQTYRHLKSLREAGDLEAFAREIEETNYNDGARKFLNRKTRALSKVNKAIRQIRADKDMSPKQKSAELRQLYQTRNAIAEATVKGVRRATAAVSP